MQFPAKTCRSLVFYPPVTADLEEQHLGRTSVGDDKRVDLPGPASSRGEISLPWDHVRVLFALYRAPLASRPPSVGDVLTASSRDMDGEQRVGAGWQGSPLHGTESDMVPTSLKGF